MIRDLRVSFPKAVCLVISWTAGTARAVGSEGARLDRPQDPETAADYGHEPPTAVNIAPTLMAGPPGVSTGLETV